MRALAIVAFCFAPACPLLDNTHRRSLSDANFEKLKLTASDAAAGDYFGHSVAIDGATVAVGAHEWGNDGPGAAYVFSLPLDEISTPQSTTALGSDSATRAGGTLATALLAFAATALAL